jgi:23S rRNA (cytidine2498-2'-O)-methyltransferase
MSESGWLMYCRAGFEAECGREALDTALQHDPGAWMRATAGSGHAVVATPNRALPHPSDGSLVFARQSLELLGTCSGLDPTDRLGPAFAVARAAGAGFREVWVETADAPDATEWHALARSLGNAATPALRKAGLHDPASAQRLHLLLLDGSRIVVARGEIARCAPWPQGIPRLRFPRGAPSRSTLKLDEAFLTLLDEDERTRWLAAGGSAVDLGAAPGGWTWQLVHRHLRVSAIDNGPMDPALLASGLVEHIRADGFAWRPRKPVDWLVCDMVEQPSRVARLIARWLVDGHARRAMFNLKLPMKKRLDAVRTDLGLLADEMSARGTPDLRARQLYHDREEITVYAGFAEPARRRART